MMRGELNEIISANHDDHGSTGSAHYGQRCASGAGSEHGQRVLEWPTFEDESSYADDLAAFAEITEVTALAGGQRG